MADSTVPETASDHALQRLARTCGIATERTAGHGEPVPVATLRRILASLGVAAENDDDVEHAVARLENEQWREVLPPVHVVRKDESFAIDVRLPRDSGRLQWHLQLEDGSERTGNAVFGELEVVGRHVGAASLECRRLRFEPVPAGYHRLTIANGAAMTLIAAPARCWLPGEADRRYWGVSAQLYLLRSDRNWGIGDFADLGELMSMVATRRGDIVGVNPLHALFPDNPLHASPYGPASRLLLNVLNISVPLLPELASSARTRALLESPELLAEIERCRAAEAVDYESVARLKLSAFEALFADARAAGGPRWTAFEAFRKARGKSFDRHCLYLALRRHVASRGGRSLHWSDWPDSLGDSGSPQVAAFAQEHRSEVDYEAWLQWLADDQLAQAANAAPPMRIGLYRDLAVGSDANGAETWSDPTLTVRGMHVGAPPDPFSETGQDWGLPPWNPRRMRAEAYASFIELVRANMRHAAALRIDHAMALQRLYWIPEGFKARDGAYVQYPCDDLFAIVALESQRARCLVIGEDLGVVPSGFRERMAAANMLSYKVLRFENRDGHPIAPAEYPRLAIAVVGNHDLATLKGWWEGRDIELEAQHGVIGAEAVEARRRDRAKDKQALLDALVRERLLESRDVPFDVLRTAVHRYVARSGALLALAQIEDIAGEEEPVNAPNVPQYASWRHRLGRSLEELADSDDFASVAAALASERPRPR